jgi:hypothetical protein
MELQQPELQLLGDRFEQYERIGHGSFGSVYRGYALVARRQTQFARMRLLEQTFTDLLPQSDAETLTDCQSCSICFDHRTAIDPLASVM